MKKGFTIVEVIFLLIIIISFSLIIFEREGDMQLSSVNIQEVNKTTEK
jgi:type II secretory pathway pseudopilin PulG